MITIGVDTGGTFTDFIYQADDSWEVYKIPSTPSNPAWAVLEGLKHIADHKQKKIIHGSTVATNAILERRGARTALITNKGFEDVIEIGRQNRTRLYDLNYRKIPPLVSSDLRFGIKGRILHTGKELEPLDLSGAAQLLDDLKNRQVQSVAVCLLFSFNNPAHEEIIGDLLKPLGISISLSHKILSEFREYERTSTTLINAYVAPRMQSYLGALTDGLEKKDKLSIMQSNGGNISAETASREPVRTILSGPAGGLVGAFAIGQLAGLDKIITFDMGGTSTDVGLIDGHIGLTTESRIADFPVKVPMIDINTVGAGGGSIVYIDDGGALRVGPASAGAVPGPICYGKGGSQITVTDANLFLGRLIPEHFLGGIMPLKRERLMEPFARMASEAGLSTVELAEGILMVANAAMEKAIRVISLERGYDPREFTLFAFGGSGAMHAIFLAELLNIHRVIIPRNPGILSAIGMLLADVIKDYSRTIMRNQSTISFNELIRFFDQMAKQGARELLDEGLKKNDVILEKYLDMRYAGQSYEIMVPFSPEYIEGFHQLHEKKYGYLNRDASLEIVNIRVRARGKPEKPVLAKIKNGSWQPVSNAVKGRTAVIFENKTIKTPVYKRNLLLNGNQIKGPAIVVEYSATTVIPPGIIATIDEYGNMLCSLK